MATGDFAFTKGHIHELQQTLKHSNKCRMEPKSKLIQPQKHHQNSNHNTPLSNIPKLAKNLDSFPLGINNGSSVHMEIPSIQKQSSI